MASDGSGKESFVPLARHGKGFLGDKPSLSQTPLGKQFPSCLLSKPWGQDSFILYFSDRLSLMPCLNYLLPLTPPPSCSPFKMVFITLPGASPVAQGWRSACSAGDPRLIPGSARPPGGGHGSPFQYSCLENPMDRGACQAIVHGVVKSQTRLKWLSTHNSSYYLKSSYYLFVLSRNSIWLLHKGVWQTAQTSPLGSAENQDNDYIVLMIKFGQ